MKNTRLILSAVIMLCITACAKEMVETASMEQQISITASNIVTKAALQGENGKVFWEPGDKIRLYYTSTTGTKTSTKNTDLTSTLTSAAATSVFTGTISSTINFDPENVQNPLWGVYPSKAGSSSDGSSVTVTLPAMQTAYAGSFDPMAYVTIGTSETLSMDFQAVGGGIRFSVTNSGIKSVSFKGASPTDTLAGSANLIIKDGVPEIQGTKTASTTVVLNAPDGQTFEPGKYYYITTLPCELKKGFEMTFTTADKTATLSSDKAVSIKRSTFGTISNADAGLAFTDKTWDTPAVINLKAGTLAMEINPVTKKPVLAIVQNVASSKGPLVVYNGLDAAPVTVTPEGNTNNQYVALGIAADGKGYAFTHNATSKKGEVYTSSDLTSWTKADVVVDQTNAYYGSTIGTLGNEAFVMTCNNSNGGVQKRNINVTQFNGTSWSTGNVLAGRAASTTYFPVMVTEKNVMYTFVTDVGTGLSIYKYDGTTWSKVVSVDATSEEYKKFGYGIMEAQGMTIAPDGQIWLAIATAAPAGIAVIKIDPEETTDNIIQIGDLIPLGTASRSAKIAMNPVTGMPILVYRNENDCLCTAMLDDETWEWKKPEVVTTYAVADVVIRYSKDGNPYIACSASDHVEVFTIRK